MANNIIVPIPTELKEIKSKLFMGLTKRQLIGFGLTGIVVIPSFLLLKGIDINLAMYGAFFLGAPIIFATIYTKDKLHIEKWFKNWLETNILFKEKRRYRLTKENREIAIQRGLIKEKRKKELISKDSASN